MTSQQPAQDQKPSRPGPRGDSVVFCATTAVAAVLVVAVATSAWWATHSQQRGGEIYLGLALIMLLAAVAVAAVGRWLGKHVRTMWMIREALLAAGEGRDSRNELMVAESIGPEAVIWNRFLAEREQFNRRRTADQLQQLLGSPAQHGAELQGACDAMSQGLIVIDEAKNVHFANGASAVFLQADRSEIAGAPVDRFVTDPAVRQAIDDAVRDHSPRRATVEVQPNDDSSSVLRFSVRPTRRDDVAAAVIIIEDITQQRVAEDARNAFVAQATHELRTPLTNIRLYVETALDEGQADPKARGEALNVINQESRRLEQLVGDMMSVAEMEAGAIQIRHDDVRLDAVFADLQRDYQAAADERQIKLLFNLPPKLPVIQGDREKLVQSLHNLLGNAIKYTQAGGHVTVNVEAHTDQLTIDVADSGIGISGEDLEHVFDKFYRAKDARVSKITGSGLGLALAREVIRLHGGDITVQSEIDKGSTFTATLPIQTEAA